MKNIEQIVSAVKNTEYKSIAQVLRALDMDASGGGSYAIINKIVKERNIDTSHWLGKAIHKGKKFGHRRPISIFLQNEVGISAMKLRLRLISEGLKKHVCERCGQNQWMGEEIPLELHHVNGVKNDNTLENLQLLCPNCHAQTNNYRGKNIKKRKINIIVKTESEVLEILNISKNRSDALKKLGLRPFGANYDRITRIIEKNNYIFPPQPEVEKVATTRVNPRKYPRPDKDTLIKLISTEPMITIAKKLGVKSDNTIRKWAETYGIDIKSISPFCFTKT